MFRRNTHESRRAHGRWLPVAAGGMLALVLCCGFHSALVAAPQVASSSGKDVEFFVPVVALADSRNLRALLDRLAAARIPYYVEPIVTERGLVHRVRVGPYSDRAEAERAREQLKGMRLSPDDVIERK